MTSKELHTSAVEVNKSKQNFGGNEFSRINSLGQFS
jgi:hypothetical protein